MRRLTCCVSVLLLVVASASADAETKFDAAARAKAIAPFVEEETAIVAHIDLSHGDLRPTFDFLSRVLTYMPVDMRSRSTMKVFDDILHSGVTEIYLVGPVLSMAPKPQLFVVFPILPGGDERALRKALRISADNGQVIDGALVLQVGDRFSKVRPMKFRPVERPELTAAFEAAGDTLAQLILIPPADTQRVVGELWPQLPQEIGGGPSSILTRGVSWAAAGVELSPTSRYGW